LPNNGELLMGIAHPKVQQGIWTCYKIDVHNDSVEWSRLFLVAVEGDEIHDLVTVLGYG
jgi:hypothetical protein